MKLLTILWLSVCLAACTSFNAEKHDIPAIRSDISINHLPVCYNHG